MAAGAKGLLAEEEERLFRLRQEIEGEAQRELNLARQELEASSRETQAGKLCATPFGVDVVGITEFIALTGALVGGALLCHPPQAYIKASAATRTEIHTLEQLLMLSSVTR